MKRVFIAGIISLFLLTACTAEITNKEEPSPSPTIETEQNERPTKVKQPQNGPTSQNLTDDDNEPLNSEEAMAFLEKAVELTSNLETVSFSSLVYYTGYFNDLNEPENSYFDEYDSTYQGTMQRTPKLAQIYEYVDLSSGTIDREGNYLYDESSRISYTNTEYFDFEQGWFTAGGDFTYAGEVTNDDKSYIRHEDLDSNFKTLEHIDAFMELFMSYPNQLSIYKDKIEDFDGEYELDNWIVELHLTNDQYYKHFTMLEYNLFTGSYNDVALDHPHFEAEDLSDLYLALSFDPSYNLVQLTVYHTYKGIDDTVDEDTNRNDYSTIRYFTFFADHNVPYSYSIPEEVILNAE